jgi:dihydroorotate dehydrogenase electron transfer subunit
MEKQMKMENINVPLMISGNLIENINLNNNYYRMRIKAPQIARKAKPGQFVMLSIWENRDPFLKRPFSFYRIEPDKGTFDILYKERGKGTQIMAKSKVGDLAELIGPLGNGFMISENTKKIAVVARGIGIAPLMPLMLESMKRGIGIYAFLSAQTGSLLSLWSNEINSISQKVFYTTDDGSKGAKGIVTDFLEDVLKEEVIDVVYVCGSKRLTKHIRNLQGKYNFLAFVSLEEHMACGIGACQGCVIKTKDGYKRVCKEGPIFPVQEVILDD